MNRKNHEKEWLRVPLPDRPTELIASSTAMPRAQLAGRTKVLTTNLFEVGDKELIARLFDDGFFKIKPPYERMWFESDLWTVALDVMGDAVLLRPYMVRPFHVLVGRVLHFPFDAQGKPIAVHWDFGPESYVGRWPAYWPVERRVRWRAKGSPYSDDEHSFFHQRLPRYENAVSPYDWWPSIDEERDRRFAEIIGCSRSDAFERCKIPVQDWDAHNKFGELDRQSRATDFGGLDTLHDGPDRSFWAISIPLMILSVFGIVAFLHCRNVHLRAAEPVIARKQDQKRLQRIYGNDVQYNVLTIRGFEHQKSDTNAPMTRFTRLHLVRGHFATYTEQNPLFGKHVGTWWWDSHARGDPALGAVAKAYEVQPG